uniref:Reverse transcriptase domain-containing protein n=1 Tax=Tanacetum cinerariifolium TaxID=118510 RepID=A0A6L2NWR3_TANCI|nr:reverse transcriptase domain-containing protein [Tanacetum cinerariifolium]
MSTRSSARNLLPPLDNPELTIRRRSRADPTILNDFEMAAEGPGDLPVPDLRTMEELCQPSLNGRGGPISPIAIQATNFGLKNDMIQKVQNSCQFHGLPGDDANKHLDKFLHVTQSIKVNGVTDDALRLYLFPHSLTHHATAWFDRLPRNLINTFEQMTKMFLSESSSSITSSSDTEIAALKAEMAEINKNLMRVLQVNQQVKAVIPNCETCGGPHSFNDCPATVGQTQNVYVAGAYQGGNSYQPQGNRNLLSYRSDNYLGPPATVGQTQNVYVAGAYQGGNSYQPQGNRIKETFILRGTTKEETNSSKELVKANDAILKNMQTNMTSLTNSNLELKNMFGQFMKMNTASSSSLGTLPVERETEVTKDMVHPTNNESIKDVQPLVVQTKCPILNSEPVVAPIIEPVDAPTRRALIDVFEGELTLHVGKEAITFNLDQTLRYSANYNDITANRIDVIDMACEEYSQEVLGFSDMIASGNPTPYYDPIVSTTSPTLTPIENSDFLLEEVDAFLALEDDPTSPEVDQSYVDTKGDILFLEAFLKDDPSLPPLNQGNYLPQV